MEKIVFKVRNAQTGKMRIFKGKRKVGTDGKAFQIVHIPPGPWIIQSYTHIGVSGSDVFIGVSGPDVFKMQDVEKNNSVSNLS